MKMTELHAKIKDMSLKRLKFEDRNKDKRLSDPSDPYFKQPTKYAMSIYSYYMCFKCKKPYFGGQKKCGQEQNKDDFDEKQLVCADCCPVKLG